MIYVIEPHADDAFLSLGGHLETWAEPTTIITVYAGDRRRAAEAQAYARAVGAAWEGLDYEGGDLLGNRGEDVPPWRTWGVDCKPGDTAIFPLGIQHPDHRYVRSLAPAAAKFYAEVPYQQKLKNRAEVSTLLSGRRIDSFMAPHGRKWRHWGLFKTQSKFFHFNPVEALARSVELIVR